MNAAGFLAGHRATIKFAFVGILSLAMLIPLVMVKGVISERQAMQRSATYAITERWGGIQTIGGLVFVSEQPRTVATDRKLVVENEWRAQVLSSSVISASLATEHRYLGIYEMPVYVTEVRIEGVFGWRAIDALQAEGDVRFWLPLGDVRGVREVSSLRIGELELTAKPLSIGTNLGGLQFTVPASERRNLSSDYRLEMTLAGSDRMMFLPLADTTVVTLETDWPHPEFVGRLLPIERTVDVSGSSARWKVLGLNRALGDQWSMPDMDAQQIYDAAFGMRLETPADGYQQSDRALKYAFLFIALTFFTLFLFEVLLGRALHPVPYVLTGSALAVFYLVLLALSEYLGFAMAYLVSAGVLIVIVALYMGTVLGARARGWLVGVMMAVTYGLLYVLVSAEQLSLLLGSLTLLAAIAGLMYLTRRVDWYAYGRGGRKQRQPPG